MLHSAFFGCGSTCWLLLGAVNGVTSGCENHWGVLQNSMVTSLLGLAGGSLKNPMTAASVGRWLVGRLVRDHGGLSFLRRDGGTKRKWGEICWEGVYFSLRELYSCHLLLFVVVCCFLLFLVVSCCCCCRCRQKLIFLRQWIIFQGPSFCFLIVRSKRCLEPDSRSFEAGW